MSLRLVPMTMVDAKRFVGTFHRHNRPPLGGIFSVGLCNNDTVIGCAIVGRPVARALDDGYTLEVTRTCVSEDAPKGSVSMLYGACRRAAAALGYNKIITNTLQTESGSSLRGAGWEQTAFLKARGGWTCPTRTRGAGTVDRTAKIRWEITP